MLCGVGVCRDVGDHRLSMVALDLVLFRDEFQMKSAREIRLVGSLKLQVSFATEPYKRDDILQKRSVIVRSLLIENRQR